MTQLGFHIGDLAPGLEQREPDIWFSRTVEPVSYPPEGNSLCFELEDDSFWFQHRNACIINAMRAFPPRGPVFDIGGGNGCVCAALNQAGIAAVLVEPSIIGARNGRLRGLRPILCSSFENAGFLKNSLPAIGMFDVVEHIQDDVSMFRQIKEILIEKGLLYITVPAYQWLWSVTDTDAAHFRRYSRGNLEGKLKACGFSIEYSTYLFWCLPVPIFLFRTLPSYVGRRHAGNLEQHSGELRPSAPLIETILNGMLQPEAAAVSRKISIPVGGSILLVARSRTV